MADRNIVLALSAAENHTLFLALIEYLRILNLSAFKDASAVEAEIERARELVRKVERSQYAQG